MKAYLFIIAISFNLLIGCFSTEQSSSETYDSDLVELLTKSKPVYPENAKLKNQEGSVELYLLIDTTGHVKKVNLIKSSGSQELDYAAQTYSSNLIFKPIIIEDKPVVKWVKWKVNYKLEEDLMAAGLSGLSILLYTKANEFAHESRHAGIEAINKLSSKFNFNAFATEDSSHFIEENLAKYDVIIFLSTSGNVLDDNGKSSLKNFINKGGGFVGIHASTDTEYNWEWYGELIGNYFKDHPKQQEAVINVLIEDHPSTKHLPSKWVWFDEWYNWSNDFNENITVLMTVDEATYEGGIHGDFHPVAWCQEFEGGRSWYTALGHREEHFKDENFLKHILGGILWAANTD